MHLFFTFPRVLCPPVTPPAANINDVGIGGTGHFNPHLPVPYFHLYSLLRIPFLSSWCIFILIAVRCEIIERDIDGKGRTSWAEDWSNWWACEKRGNDWLGDWRESEGEDRRMKDGWRAEEKRRDQHGTNCFLCIPTEPRSAIHHAAAISPAQTLWQMRPSSHSARWDGASICRCAFEPAMETDLRERALVRHARRWTRDEFVCLPDGRQ